MGNLKFGLALENFTPAEKVPDVASIVTYARRWASHKNLNFPRRN